MSPEIIDTWTRILKRVPGSILWMQRTPEAAVDNILYGAQLNLKLIYNRKEVKARGIEESRIVFSQPVEWNRHLSVKSASDLFLDTPLYNAHGSGTDILWAGMSCYDCN